MKKRESVYVLVFSMIALAGCGPTMEDAKEAGFASVKEMKAYQEKGFKTMADFESKEAERLGFQGVQEMKRLQAQGFENKKKYLEKLKADAERLKLDTQTAISLGFSSAAEMYTARKRGFNNKSEYEEGLYKDICREDYKKCKNNTDVVDVNFKVPIDGKVACKVAAERAARWDVDWGSWYEPNFSSYLKGTSAKDNGTITLVDTVAKYQNGFSAWARANTTCLYNIETMVAVIISVDR